MKRSLQRFFIDASVFFAGAYSVRGHAHDLLVRAAEEPTSVTLVVSDDVIDETRRNLAESAPEKLVAFERLLERLPFEKVNPTRRSAAAAAKLVIAKDAHIIAAARKAKVDLLVTFDKKHLLGKPDLAKYVGAAIVTPEQAMKLLLAKKVKN